MGKQAEDLNSPPSVNDSVDVLEEKYKRLVKGGRKAGMKLAAEHLEYWLSKKGGTKTILTSYFENDETLNAFLIKKVRGIFLSRDDKEKGIAPRIAEDEKVGKEYELEWTDSMNAKKDSDLWFALGGFTVISTVKMKVIKIQDGFAKVKFKSWKCRVKDVYDWDKHKKVLFAGFEIRDEAATKLEKAGRAKKFNMKTEPWEVTNQAVIKDATVKLPEKKKGRY